jgi:hypothetical protein
MTDRVPRALLRLGAVVLAVPLLAFVVSVMGNTWGYNDSGVVVYAAFSWWPAWLAVLVLGLAFDVRPGALTRWLAGATAVCGLALGLAVVVAAFGSAARGGGWTAGRPSQALVELGLGSVLLVVGALAAALPRRAGRAASETVGQPG